MQASYLVEMMARAPGQETLVFKAIAQDSLKPGDPMYICVPSSCCAHVNLKKIDKIVHRLRRFAILRP